MKVAQVTQHYRPIIGGQEVYIENLQTVLAEAGIQGTVYQPDRGVQADDIVRILRLRGIPRLIRGAEPYLFNFFLHLTQMERLAQADVIIAHYAFSAWALKRLAHKTIVLSHGIEWHLENMTWDDRVHERVAKACLEKFTHVVNDTHYLRHFGYTAPPAKGCFTELSPGKWFIPNCVDTIKFQATAGLPALKQRNIILVPRQLAADRGIDLAVKAFRLLADENKELTLCLLGKRRPGRYINYIEQLIKSLGLGRRVFFEPDVENKRMPHYYSSALVTLIPTLRREGTSLSALESMSCGIATVSTNVAGLADLPTVQCNPDEIAVAQALKDTLRKRTEIGISQQETVRRIFNTENWSNAWLQVIRCVTSG
jgi:glycosyltransferase involved in cell wall biosynthesis